MFNKLHNYLKKASKFIFDDGTPEVPEESEGMPSSLKEKKKMPAAPGQQPQEAMQKAEEYIAEKGEELSVRIDVENPPSADSYPDTPAGRRQKEKDEKYFEEFDERQDIAENAVARLKKTKNIIDKIKSEEAKQPPVNKKLEAFAKRNGITKRGNAGEVYISDSLQGTAVTRPPKFQDACYDSLLETANNWAKNNEKKENRGDLTTAFMRMARSREFNQWEKNLETLENALNSVGV